MENRKTMKLQKRVAALFFTLLMFFSCFGEGISTVVEAADVSSTEHHISGYGFDFSSSGLGKAYNPTTQKNDDTSFQRKYCKGYWYYFTNERGEICYCLELGVKHYDSVKQMEMDFKQLNRDNNYSKYFNTTQQDWLKYATVYGYKGKTHYGYSSDEELIATQLLVWSISAKYYDTTKSNLGTNETKMLNCLVGSKLNKSHIKDIWQKMKSNIRNHSVIPNKTATRKNNITTKAVHKLSYNVKNNKWGNTIKFDNYLDMYSLSSLSGVTMTKKNTDSNYRDDSLVISASKTGDFKDKIVTLTKATSMQGFKVDKCSPLILIAQATKATQMKISYYNEQDPVTAYFALTPDVGNIELHKKFSTAQGQSLTMTEEWRNAIEFKLKYTYNGMDFYVVASGSDGNYTFVSANTTDSSQGTTFKLDNNGYIKVNDVPTGSYKWTEIQAPDGFKLSNETVLVVNYNQTTQINFTNRQNTPNGATLTMSKVITDVNSNTTNKHTSELTDVYAQTKFIASVKLDSGETVYLKHSSQPVNGVHVYSGSIYDRGDTACLTDDINEAELLTPCTSPYGPYGDILLVFPPAISSTSQKTGMVLVTQQKNPVTLTEVKTGYAVGLKGSNKVYLFSDREAQLTNSEIPCQVNLRKLDAETNAYVAGAEYTLYAREDVINVLGTKIYSAGDAIQTITTTTSGNDHFNVVRCGKYYVKETKAPQGYLIDTNEYDVVFDGSHDGVANANVPMQRTVTSKETPMKGKIHINKIDSEINTDNGYTVSNDFKARLKDVTFTLTPSESIGSFVINGVTYNHNNPIILKTNENGEADFAGFPLGTYELKETGTAAGYYFEDNETNITFNNGMFNQNIGYSFRDLTIGNKPHHVIVEVNKKNNYDEKVEGAEFTITANKDYPDYNLKAGDVICKIITDENGVATTQSLSDENGVNAKLYEGIEYKIKETAVPTNYVATDWEQTFTVDISTDTSIQYQKVSFDVTNDWQQGTIKVVKIDNDNNEYTLAGAKFGIYANDDIQIWNDETNGYDTYVTGDLIETIITGEDGRAETVKHYPVAHSYTIKEIETPYGYNKAEDTIITMPYNQTVVNSEITTVIGDDRQQGRIKLFKVDKEDNSKKLAGAVFNVVANEDIIVHGIKLYSKDDVIETIITGEDGSAFTSSLYTGFTYKLVEVKAPDGYVLSGSKEFTLDYDNQAWFVEAETTIENAPTDITIEKKDFSTGELIPNCGIEILDESQNVLVQGRTDEQGKVTFKRLPMGNYYFREFDAPEGYYLDTTPHLCTIGEDGVVKAEMTNKLQELVLNIYKTDGESKKALAGAEFTVYDNDGNELGKVTTGEDGNASTRGKITMYAGREYIVRETKAPQGYKASNFEQKFSSDFDSSIEYHEVNISVENAPTEVTITKTDFSTGELIPDCGIEILDEDKNVIVQGRTDDKGEVTFKRLPVGKYYYREFDAPKGYYLDTTPYAFTIGEDGVVKAKMTNKLQEVILNIYKTDGETKKALAGAEFTVYDKGGNELGKITTDENGQATTRDKIKLYAGVEYNVKETKAPDGYRESNWEKTFSSDYDSSIEYHEVNLSVENTKKKGKFELYKVDSVSGNKLAGAEYEIFDESGKSVFKGTTNSDGYLTCELPLGKYSYKETKAPENYVLDEKTYTFEFTEDGQVFTTTQKNEYGGGVTVSQTPETPNRQVTTQDTPNASTGTSRNAAPFALAMTLCVATAVAASKRKKQTK